MSNLCLNHFQNDNVSIKDYYSNNIYTWCTNCGNYGIAAATKRALVAENIHPKDVLLCFDIGCNGNGSDKIGGYRIHGLHGRVIPLAAGAALANDRMTVIASGGDGATLSEGIGHLVHAIRSNYNITFLMHNNCNYGLTTGQASASTKPGIPMNSSPYGTTADTMNFGHFVLSLGASFFARTFSGNVNQMTEIVRTGIRHKGFSVIEILQNCPTYNKATTHEWYQDRIYDALDVKDYNKEDLQQALQISLDLEEKIATGILYQNPHSVPFHKRQHNREGLKTELVDEVTEYSQLTSTLFEQFA